MKKLKLEKLNLGNDAEVLSREELKKVLGGMGSGGSGGGSGYCGTWGTAHCGGNYIPKKCGGPRGNYVVYCADPITGTCYSFSGSSGSDYWCEG
ncbi:MAG TPA: hypothetical protein VK084_02465 [Chitinophagaceae bacterium]|nr:hypothetical protein [Chitinophagaceae bacterium]